MAVDRAAAVLSKEQIMNKPKWLPRTLHILRKAFFAVAALIVVLFALAVAVIYFILQRPIECDPMRMPFESRPTVESPQPTDVALNRIEK